MAINHIDNSCLEWRRHLVFNNLDLGHIAIDIIAVFECFPTAYIQPHRRIELQCPAAWGCLRIAEHDADLFTQLINEDRSRIGMVHGTGQFAHGFGHQSGLQAYGRISHFTIQFCLRHQSSNGVNDDQVNGTALNEHFADIQGLFTGIRLGQNEFININAQGFGILGIDGIFSIDEGTSASLLLTLGNGMQGKGCFTGRFRTINLDDSSLWIAANAKGSIQSDGTGRNCINRYIGTIAKPHDTAFAIFLFNCFESIVQQLIPAAVLGSFCFFFFCHLLLISFISI